MIPLFLDGILFYARESDSISEQKRGLSIRFNSKFVILLMSKHFTNEIEFRTTK